MTASRKPKTRVRDEIEKITGISQTNRLRMFLFSQFGDDIVFKALMRRKKGKVRDVRHEALILEIISHKVCAKFYGEKTH